MYFPQLTAQQKELSLNSPQIQMLMQNSSLNQIIILQHAQALQLPQEIAKQIRSLLN